MQPDAPKDISRLAQLVTAAQRVATPLRTLAIFSLLAGLWLWSLPVSPNTLAHWWTVLGAGVLLLVLITPTVIVLLFYLGVRQIVTLPNRLTGMTRDGVDKGRQLLASMKTADGTPAIGRRRTIVRAAIDLARGALDAKGLVMDTVSLVRLLNPITLMIVSIAIVFAVTLIGIAAVAALVVVVF
jgi:hypothetical protein